MHKCYTYCITCQKVLYEGYNGSFMEAVGKLHEDEHPGHEVLIGCKPGEKPDYLAEVFSEGRGQDGSNGTEQREHIK